MRKPVTLGWTAFCTFIVLFFNACKKESSSEQHPDLNLKQAINKISVGLENQKSTSDQQKNDRIQLLKENLDYSQIRFEKLRDEEQFIIVPIKDGFPTVNNQDKNPVSVLLLILNNKGVIRKGNIAQYIPESKPQRPPIPINSFFNIFNAETPLQDAQFSFLTLTDKLEYEIKFKDGRMVSTGTMKPLKKSVVANRPIQDPIAPAPMCTDWYLVTIYYYPDGSTSQTERYVYTTCEPTSGGGGDGGGTGENSVAYEFLKSKDVEWTIAKNPDPNENGVGEIKSIETLKGKKVSSEPQGGHFVSIEHRGSGCNFCGSYNPSDVWVETSYTGSAAGQQASSSVSGTLYYNRFTYSRDKTQTWSFQEIFPR